MMLKTKIHYLILFGLISFALSNLNTQMPIEFLIDPSNPETSLVKKFQEKYMAMNNNDLGYGSFGPKTTKEWKSIISNPSTYDQLFELSLSLKDKSNYQDSNMILHYLIDSRYASNNIKIKSKFMRAQLFYDLSYFEESVSYFELLLSENIDNDYRKKSLFMIAYIYNNNLDMYTDALSFYNQFLNDYSSDDLVASVKYEIKQINNVLINVKD